MKEFLTPFTVGLVVIAGLVSGTWMFGQVKEGIGDDPSGYRVSAVLDDVGGLAQKSRVVIAGITVGQIDKIELEGDKARVWLLVNTPLRSDAKIAKRQASLLGENFLQLSPGYKGIPLKDGDEITDVIYDVSPADLMKDAKKIVENVDQITTTIRNVLAGEEGEQKLAELVTDVNATVSEVRRIVAANSPKIDIVVDNVVHVTGEARGFVGDFRREASRILTNAERVTADARVISGSVRQIVGENKGSVAEGFDGVKGAVARLGKALDKLDGTLERTTSIATKIDEGQGTIGRLINDDHLVNSVTELVDESRVFVRQLTRLQMVVAMRSEYYLGQRAAKNYLTLKIKPKPDKYYMLQIVDDPRGKTRFRETVTNSSDSATDPLVREQETITEDSFKLSLQFAKRLYFATGRVGIIESSGGLGVDFHFFDDDLQIAADIFQFDANVNPRIRLAGTYTFFRHLYIAAGVDEVWNDQLTDFFIGAGIEFTDADLQAILVSAPTPSL